MKLWYNLPSLLVELPMPEYSTSKVMQTMPRLPLKGSLDLTHRCDDNCRHCWLCIPPGAPEEEI